MSSLWKKFSNNATLHLSEKTKSGTVEPKYIFIENIPILIGIEKNTQYANTGYFTNTLPAYYLLTSRNT